MFVDIEIPVEVKVTHYVPGDPGNVYGKPENCWPPSPPDIEIEVWSTIGEPQEISDIISEEELECLEKMAIEEMHEV